MDYIRIEGVLILPARVDGSPDVFQCPCFTLVKPSWVPDDNAKHCELCSTKFTQLKRRHHCRMCGAVRCGKCCNEKIPLPQLGIEDAERVCDSCRTVTELVTKSRSSIETYLTDSAKGLASFAKHDKHLKKLIELGGMQALITLASTDNSNVLSHVVSGLQSLSTHTVLHRYLADAGAIKAICKILSTVGDSNEQIALDGISSLKTFCSVATLKAKALSDGGMQPVLNLCWSRNDSVVIMSVHTLSQIADNTNTHPAIFDSKMNIVPRLLQLSSCSDEQVQEVALKALAILSTGLPQHKHRIVQENINAENCLLRVLESNPNNPQILCNMACLLANLATNSEDQASLQGMMFVACQKLPSAEANTELLCHLTRALANFAIYKINLSYLINYVVDIIRYGLKSSTVPVQSQSMRLLLSLLVASPARMASLLISEGGTTFFTQLGQLNGLMDAVQTSLANDAPAIAKPL
ncbi:hypothetical protein BgiMline_005937 [Biomphalaria glabrata]|nr:vacuolar protein 8-like [Biomphalaria glabrata]